MKIKISKSQWENIGNKAGWDRVAMYGDNTTKEEDLSENKWRERNQDNIRKQQFEEDKITKKLEPLFRAVGKEKGSIDQLVSILTIAKQIEVGKGDINSMIIDLKKSIRGM